MLFWPIYNKNCEHIHRMYYYGERVRNELEVKYLRHTIHSISFKLPKTWINVIENFINYVTALVIKTTWPMLENFQTNRNFINKFHFYFFYCIALADTHHQSENKSLKQIYFNKSWEFSFFFFLACITFFLWVSVCVNAVWTFHNYVTNIIDFFFFLNGYINLKIVLAPSSCFRFFFENKIDTWPPPSPITPTTVTPEFKKE